MKNNRLIAMLMAGVMLFGLAGCGSKSEKTKASRGDKASSSIEETVLETTEETTESTVAADVFAGQKIEEGATVIFGMYTPRNKNNTDPIAWTVLKVDGNKALLVSTKVIDAQPYNTEEYAADGSDVTWENCSLRTWLNNDFMNEAFSDAEKSVIKTVTLKNPKNTFFGTDGGNDTEDKVFILSAEEISEYYGFQYFDEERLLGYNGALMTSPVDNLLGGNKCIMWEMYKKDYDQTYKAYGYSEDLIGKKGAKYWVRTPGVSGHADSYTTCTALIVGSHGETGQKLWCMVTEGRIGIRPAIYVEF